MDTRNFAPIIFVILVAIFGGAHPARSAEPAGIYGRVWVNNIPSPKVDVKVYVVDGNAGQPIGVATSRKGQGPSSGNYSISNLPSAVKLRVEATHPTWPKDPAITFVTLKPGEAREVHLSVEIRSNPGPGHPNDPR